MTAAFAHPPLLPARPAASARTARCTAVLEGARAAAVAAAAAALVALAPSAMDARVALGPEPAFAAKGGGDTFLSASGDVNKDAESLLRWSLPVRNQNVRTLQSELEAVVTDSRGLKWSKIEGHLKKGAMVANVQRDAILKDVPAARREEAAALLERIQQRLPGVDAAVAEKSVDKVIAQEREVLRDVGSLEELMVTGFPFKVPSEFDNLPQLLGRATVDVVVRKDGDEPFDIDGTIYKEGEMTLVLDGYSAPVSAGAFLDLVSKGFYNDLPVLRSDGFIVQSGKPEASDGYVDSSGNLRTIPLEVFARGDKEPIYGLTLEEDGRGAAGTVLPFTSYGTLAMAREEFAPDTASSQYFWFLFEPDLTPAGRNLMDGSWAVFGYTTEGQSFLKGLQKGDRIVSAKVVDGLQNLVVPAEQKK